LDLGDKMKIIADVICDCGWEIEIPVKLNKFGFYSELIGYCPKCFNKVEFVIKEEKNKEFGKLILKK
jgi:hypothetical protein